MKKIIMICILCFCGIKAYSQLLEDRNNVYVAYQTGLYIGSELFNNQGTRAPSFYSNLTSNNGLVVKEVFRLSSYCSAGLKIGLLASTNWQSKSHASYNDSKSTTLNLQPVFRINNKFQENGLLNQLRFYGELSPVLGWSMISIKNNVFHTSDPQINNVTFKMNDFIYGMEVGVGCDYGFTNKLGAFIHLSVQEGFINTPYFLDNRYTLLNLNVGVRMNISKVKRFNY